MLPPVFAWLSADSAVVGMLGSGSILKVFEDEAPQGTALAYLVWGIVGGVPDNYLTDAPGIDNARLQFDIYAPDQLTRDAVYVTVRDVLEQHGRIVSFNGTFRDPDTRAYRLSFDFSAWTNRA